MKFNYYPETDSLYIDLSSKKSVTSEEVSEGVIIDYDEDENIVGIDIDNASKKINLDALSFSNIPFKTKPVTDSIT